MPKNASRDQKQNADNLRRRPIHPKTQTSDENHTEELSNDSKSSPEKLYPDLTDEHKLAAKEESDECNDTISNSSVWESFSYYQIFFLLSNKKNILWITFLVMLFLYFFNAQKSAEYLSLQEKLNNMKDHFNDQNRLTFRVLEKALEKVVNVTEEPSAPAIFTVIVNRNAIYKSHEFLHHLANTLAPQNIVWINESMSWHSNPNGIKMKIDQDVHSKVSEKELFVVIVDNLQNIPLQGAMIFHSFCDHESAPFKQGVFIFIVPINNILSADTPLKKIDQAAFQELKNIWSYASSDEIDSLITRITVNVISII